MKKNWKNPELSSLDITSTAGGPAPEWDQDGEKWWNPDRGDQGEWEIPIGEKDPHGS